MVKSLDAFDTKWKDSFVDQLNAHPLRNRLKRSLESLKDNRNSFAHGYAPATTFKGLCGYFRDACILLRLLDRSVT